MESQVFIKPKNKGAIIRDPLNKSILNEIGEIKPWTGKEGTYWRRRVKDGSCIILNKNEIKERADKIENERKESIKRYEDKDRQTENDNVKFDNDGNIINKKGGK